MVRRLGVLILVITLLWPSMAVASDNITWDNNYSRNRITFATMGQLYNAAPIALSIGDVLHVWVYSNSTPIVYGNTLYQYCWNTDIPEGFLVAVDISKANPQTPSDFKILWVAKFTAQPGERLDGAPGPSISPDGQYMSIAVGQYIYIWPMSVNGSPNVPDSNGQMEGMRKYIIYGNTGQTTNLIAMSPAITKQSYNDWQGMDIDTGEMTTFSAPVVVAGSWNGGFTAAPLYVLDNIDSGSVRPLNQQTTSIDPSWSGEIFTSSPAVQNDGNGDVLFGVDGGYPLLFDLHPYNLTVGTLGGGIIQYGVASPPAIDPFTGNIYVPDKLGNIYRFQSDGTYVNKCSELSNGNLIISNISIDQKYIYAVKSGGSEVHAIDKYTMLDQSSVFPASTGYVDPCVISDQTGGVNLVAVNDANGYIYITAYDSSTSGVFSSSGSLSTSAKGYAPPPYISVVMDAGPNQLIASWTDDAVAGGETGALEFWVPQASTLTASVNPEKNQPNATATLNVDTTVPNTMSDVVAQLPDANGNPVQITQATVMNYTSSSPGTDGTTIYHWQLQFPVHGTPGTYNIPVQLNFTSPGSTTAPIRASSSYEVIKPPGGVVTDNGATLSLQSFCAPKNTRDQVLNFKSWRRDQLYKMHPPGKTYLGDTILADLTVDTPKLPDSSDILVRAYLTQARITHPAGSPSPDGHQWQVNPITQDMTITNSLTATWQFMETWGGWGPGRYAVMAPDWAYRSPTYVDPDPPDVIGVDYVVHVVYEYPVVVCGPKSCWIIYQTAEMDVPGTVTAQIQVWGTDFVVVPTLSGDSYT